jgi:DNA repair exonuclease SbcCD ATPase subunit
MIVFDRIKYSNFLASGQVPIDIPLNAHASTLIVGRNGAGKSTMTEAVCFALFGRALRNITKPALVNSINKRDALVELWFHIDQVQYLIRRGIKPNVFEIYVDGDLVPPPAALTDYQIMLETQILGLNYKSFMQIVVLGSASYVPFMRLSPAQRREIIEDLLDIEVFSVMNTLAKDELSTVKATAEKLTQERRSLEEQLRMGESFVAQISEDHEARRATLLAEHDRLDLEIQALREQKTALEDTLIEYVDAQAHLTTMTQKLHEYENTSRSLAAKTKKIDKERTFYADHDECPTCTQSITPEFKDERFLDLDSTEVMLQKAATQCAALITKYTQAVAVAQQAVTEEQTLRREIAGIDASISHHLRRQKELRTELGKDSPTIVRPVVDLEELRKKLLANETALVTVTARREILEVASFLLKDSGIKSRVIKHYLPIINKQINTYLAAMDFPIHFSLDEEFNEIIQSQHRDDFSYESFSEGERKRIDIALLLSWRAVARLKNSASCNMLVLDEVFDSSLDIAGTEEFLKIIHALEQTNVFVISHKTDTMLDKFAHVITFQKHRGFSSLQ